MRVPSLILVAVLGTSCASAPAGPPSEVGGEIVLALDEGREARAQELFESSSSADWRNRLYPVLFGTAGDRFSAGNSPSSTPILRFMHARYESESVEEALLYSLFVDRSRQSEPDPALVEELANVIATMRAKGSSGPWLELAAVQNALDRGRPNEADPLFDQFLATWDGEPQTLQVYVEDLNRRLVMR